MQVGSRHSFDNHALACAVSIGDCPGPSAVVEVETMTGAKRLGVQRRRTETQPFRCNSADATFRLETQNIFTGSWAWVAAGPVAHSTSDHVGTGRRFNDLGFELGGPAGRQTRCETGFGTQSNPTKPILAKDKSKNCSNFYETVARSYIMSQDQGRGIIFTGGCREL